MIISIMEKLASVNLSGVESWVDFYNWVSKKEITQRYENLLESREIKSFKQLMSELKSQYSSEFGSINKVVNFLSTSMDASEKQALIKSIKFMREVPELPPFKMPEPEPNADFDEMLETMQSLTQDSRGITFENEEAVKEFVKQNGSKKVWEALPACYDGKQYWRCYAIEFDGTGHGYCRFKYDCALLIDKQKLEECFRSTVKMVYEWRSKFVHDVELPPVRENAIFGTRYKNNYVIGELTTTDFKAIFERLVKRFFDSYQATKLKNITIPKLINQAQNIASK